MTSPLIALTDMRQSLGSAVVNMDSSEVFS